MIGGMSLQLSRRKLFGVLPAVGLTAAAAAQEPPQSTALAPPERPVRPLDPNAPAPYPTAEDAAREIARRIFIRFFLAGLKRYAIAPGGPVQPGDIWQRSDPGRLFQFNYQANSCVSFERSYPGAINGDVYFQPVADHLANSLIGFGPFMSGRLRTPEGIDVAHCDHWGFHLRAVRRYDLDTDRLAFRADILFGSLAGETNGHPFGGFIGSCAMFVRPNWEAARSAETAYMKRWTE